ncbi:MAG: type II secretion system F family protein [Ilumatobacteraceae bacterium]
MEERLRQAGASISPARYRATIVGSIVAMFIVVYGLTGTPALAIPPAIAVGMAPRAFYRRRYTAAMTARVAAWPEAIRDVLAHLGVGHTLHRSLCLLGTSGPEPLRAVWTRFERNAASLDVTTALSLAQDELADPVSDRVIEAFIAANERGQSVIIEILRSMADNVSRDVQTAEQIVTNQMEVRSQAVVAVILPFLVLGFLVISNDAYRGFYRSPGGWMVIALGAGMASGGWKLITVLGRIDGEPRVLGRAKSAAR